MASPPVQVRVPSPTLAALDEARGDESRSAWILGAIGLRLSPVADVVAELTAPAIVAAAVRGVNCPHPKGRVHKGLCHQCGTGGLA